MIGTNFPYTQHLPTPGKVRVVQIEADPTRAGVRMPTEVPVIGDAKESLQALLPGVQVRSSEEAGLPPLQVEACAFAWLAMQCVERRELPLESTTGARGARVLGAVWPA